MHCKTSALAIVVLSLISLSLRAEEQETVLDRRVHVEKELISEVPKVPPLCDELPGLRKQRVDLGDVTLYCEQEGEGTAVVLLHGGPGATHHEFHPWFSECKPFARIIYYDQRGCGQSDYKPGDGYTVRQAADDLHRLRKAMGLTKWVVLGHSYGGALAQCYAVEYPEDLAGLVLVGSGMTAPIPLKRTRQYEFMAKEELRGIGRAHSSGKLTVEQSIYNAFLNGDWKRQCFVKPSPQQIARIARYEWRHDQHFNAVMSGDLGKYDLQGAMDRCPIPTMIVEGVWDLTWNTDKPEKLHRMLPRATLVMIDRAGHSPFADVPEQFARRLKEFLQGLPPVSAEAVSEWRKQLQAWKSEREKSPKFVLRAAGSGRKSNQRLAEQYRPAWLEQLDDPNLLLKLGMALYDVKQYAEALRAFEKISQTAAGDKVMAGIAGIWQGQMLDLLGRREQAIAVYTKVRDLKLPAGFAIRHDQFGLVISPSQSAAERLEKPFVRVENQMEQ